MEINVFCKLLKLLRWVHFLHQIFSIKYDFIYNNIYKQTQDVVEYPEFSCLYLVDEFDFSVQAVIESRVYFIQILE